MIKTGDRVELIEMNDPYTKLKAGDIGVVKYIDDSGTIFCTWQNGEGLGLVKDVDKFRVLK